MQRIMKILGIAGISLLFFFGVLQRAQALPIDFQDEPVLSGLNLPLNLVTLPDSRMLVLQKGGEIRIFDPQVAPTTSSVYMTITDIESGDERGLASLVLDPDFLNNNYFYVYYTHASSAKNRISRFTHNGNTASIASEFLVWEDNEVWSERFHYGGGLDFGPDGKLYLTTGEEFDGAQAQDLTRAGGKIIRVNKDGTIPLDNPFADGPGGNLDEIWAYGLRNPYRAKWDIPNNRFYIGDVGGNIQATAREELNFGRAGANYGWPILEGFGTNPAYDNPIYDYGHTGTTPNGAAITAGFVYNGTLFPSEYSGVYFLADYVLGWIRYLNIDVNGQVTNSTDFSTTVNNVTSLVQGPEGALYYTDIFGEVRRINYIPANRAPVISSVTATPISGLAPLSSDFTVTATDLENDPLTYSWFFGDGTTGSGTSVTHVYNSDGLYTVTVQVSDPTGTTTSNPITIQVGNPPQAQINTPANGILFRGLEVINFSGTATDPDETLGESNYSWTVRLLHDTHTHPILDNMVGSSGNFQVSNIGHDFSGTTLFEIILTATDSTGVIGTDRIEIFPDKVNLNLSTAPAGQTIYLDNNPLGTPLVYDTLIGFNHTVSAPGTFCDIATNTNYNFSDWSDGGTQTHQITVPTVDLNLTANYTAAGPCTSLVTTGLSLHLEADQGLTSTAGSVIAWSDLSLTGNDLGASGNPQRIVATDLNHQLAVSFDGVDDLLNLTHSHDLAGANTDRTIYMIAKYNGTGFGGFAYGSAVCNRAFGLVVDTSGNLAVQGWCPQNDFSTTVPGTSAGWLTQAVVLESGLLSHYRDSVLIDSQTHTYDTNIVANNLVLGAELDSNRFTNMNVAALLVYDRALSAAERQQVELYLNDKYFPNGNGGSNQPPLAVDDNATVSTAGSVNIAVLSNDTDADGSIDPATVAIVSAPANGTLLDDGTGLLTYTHDGSATTSDSLIYTVADTLGGVSNTATVAITITGAGNQPPVATDDSATVSTAGSVNIAVLSNDTDVDGTIDPATVTIVTTPANGALLDDGTGLLTYTHDGSATISDTFTYTVADTLGGTSNTAIVTLTVVTPVPITIGLVLSLDADAGITNNAGVVMAWQDQSGMGNDVVSLGDPMLVSGALNGHPVIDFDGIDDTLERTLTLNNLPAGNTDRTVFLVGNYRGIATGFGGFAYGTAACSQAFGLVVDGTGQLTAQGYCTDFISTTPGVGAGWLTQSIVLNAGVLEHYKDGTQIDTASYTFNTVLSKIALAAEITGNDFIDMQIATVLVYNRALSATERQQVETYLNDKYFPGGGGSNQLPVAVDDNATVSTTGSVNIAVLSNDTDADGSIDPATVAIVSAPANGALLDDGTGVLTYTHDGSATTIDSFTYTVADTLGGVSNTATVAITITGAGNQPPVATDDSATVSTAGSVNIAVLSNDTDVDGTIDPATVTIVTAPANGTLLDDGTGLLTYTHNGSATIGDTFTYTVADTLGGTSNTATVTLTVVTPVPITIGLVLSLDADAGVTNNAGVVMAWQDQSGMGNDVVSLGDPMLVSGALNGHPVIDFDGIDDTLERTLTLNNLPAGNTDRTVFLVGNYRGIATGFGGFAYGTAACSQAFGLVVDGTGQLTAQGYCTDFISTTPGVGAGWLTQSIVLNAGVLEHYKDGTQIDTASYTFNTVLSKIALAAEITGNDFIDMQIATVLVYNRALSATERQQVETYLNDKYFPGNGGSNQPPLAVDDNATVSTAGSVNIAVLSNDTDADGTIDPATVTIVTAPANGTLLDDGTGLLTYTHDGSATTSDGFTYTVRDTQGGVSNTAIVAITISSPPTNQPPVTVDDNATLTTASSVNIAVLTNDTDTDGAIDPATVTIVTAPANGTLLDDGAGVLTYTHDGSTTSNDTFTYTVADTLGATSAIATVSITITAPANLPPVAVNDSIVVTAGSTTPITVLSNDSDPDGTIDSATINIVTPPVNGSVIDSGLGTLTYTHNGSATINDSFTYTVNDNLGAISNIATVTISVNTITPDGDLAPPGAPDGLLNAADILVMERIVLGIITPTTLEMQHGDLYPPGAPDGVIDMSDLILQRQLILP